MKKPPRMEAAQACRARSSDHMPKGSAPGMENGIIMIEEVVWRAVCHTAMLSRSADFDQSHGWPSTVALSELGWVTMRSGPFRPIRDVCSQAGY
jgi:hypothetical protein